MATVQLVTSKQSASQLADLLNGATRRKPVVVVTTSSGQERPWIDPQRIAQEAGSLADVYLMPTGDISWAFAHQMADETQVYGGAGRVYPVGHEWTSNPRRSPLRFAFNPADGEWATDKLISDALRMAADAGLLQPVAQARPVAGIVTGVISGRGIVDLSQGLRATIAEELTVPGVRIERLLTVGQQVSGLYDPEAGRVDVRGGLRPAEEALAGYGIGDVVLARVAMVRNGKAELVLYPKTAQPEVRVAVLRAAVTTNEADDLRTLMSLDEVVRARVTATGPSWCLTMADVDDDEPVAQAPALLAGGPPWLIEELPTLDVETPPTVAMPAQAPPAAQEPIEPEPAVAEPEPEAPAAPAPPTPAIFGRRPTGTPAARPATPGPVPRPPSTPPIVATPPEAPSDTRQQLLLQITALKTRIATLEAEAEKARALAEANSDEIRQLRYVINKVEAERDRAENGLARSRTELRKARGKRSRPAAEEPQFADPELGFRHLVQARWATRTPVAEQAARPLPEYGIGAGFIQSLADLEGVSREKVADVVVEVVTGVAPKVAGREVHRLRSGLGGADPVRTRPDGAVGYRASLQTNTPSARRIHYWTLPGGQIELARVCTHDDFSI